MKTRLLSIVLTLFAVLMLAGCGDSKSEQYEATIQQLEENIQALEGEKEALGDEIVELQSEIDYLNELANSSDSSLIATIFWEDGNIYYVENCRFFTDSYCSQELISEYIRFYSPTALKIGLENGNSAYCSFSNHGIIWSVDKPRFKEVNFEG